MVERTVACVAIALSVGATNQSGESAIAQRTFAMHEVYATQLDSSLHKAAAALSSDGNHIYILSRSNIERVNWRSGSRQNAAAPAGTEVCGEQDSAQLQVLSVDAGTLLVYWCRSLLLLDSQTLSLKRRLAVDPSREVRDIVVSPDGKWAIVGTSVSREPVSQQLDLYDITSSGQAVSLGSYADYFAFAGDGKHLIVRRENSGDANESVEWLEAITIPRGKVMRSWLPPKGSVQLGRMSFLRSRPNTMVTGVGTRRLVVCNVLDGSVGTTIASGEIIRDVLVDPAGAWVIATVGRSEHGGHLLRAWDLETGRQVFQKIPDSNNGEPDLEPAAIVLLGVSGDGKRVLINIGTQLHVCEIVY